jgi:hypothetical protein
MTDDITAAVRALQAEGSRSPADQRPGLRLLTAITLPRGVELGPLPAPALDCGTAGLSSIYPRSGRSGVNGGSRSPRRSFRKVCALSVCGSGDLLDCHLVEAKQTVPRTIAAIQS